MSKAYLEEGFDPSSLKVSQLRGILNEHDIPFASNAKKAQLVQLFNDEIAPQAQQLLAEHNEHVKNRNDSGFVDMESDSDANLEIRSSVTTVATPDEVLVVEQTEVSDAADSPFSNDNVFQSADSSMNRKRPHEPVSGGSSPSNKKRVVSSDNSPRSEAGSPTVKSPTKSIFDDSDDSITTLKVKSPKIKKDKKGKESHKVKKELFETPKKLNETPEKLKDPKKLKETPEKLKDPKKVRKTSDIEPTEHSIRNVKSPKTRQSPKQEELVKKETPKKEIMKEQNMKDTSKIDAPTKSTPKKSTPRKSTPKKPTPKSAKKDQPIESYKSINEELDDFDKELRKIKGKNDKLPVFDLNLASQLGVTIQGSPPSPEPHTTPVATPRKSVNADIPGLTPKPRLVPINPIKSELSEDEEEEEGEDINVDEVKENMSSNTKFGSVFAFTFISWIVLVLSGLFAFWYREQQFLIGYCGHEINRVTFPQSENPWVNMATEYLDNNFKPACVPCPPHARCFSNLELGCFEDFVEYKPWNNFLKPYNKRCVPDTKKAEKLEIMIDVALDLLRTKNANVQCGQSTNIEDSGIKLQELHDLLLSMKAPYITNEEFEELWQRSIVELEKESEVITGYTSVSPPKLATYANHSDNHDEKENKILRSTSISNLSLKCQVKNSVIGSFIQYKFKLVGFLFLFGLFKFLQYRYHLYQAELLKQDAIYREVIEKLQNQYRLSKQVGNISPSIGAIQLRDLILADEHNLKTRLKVWNAVANKVEHNTNISAKQMENHGEIMTVWQWITHVDD